MGTLVRICMDIHAQGIFWESSNCLLFAAHHNVYPPRYVQHKNMYNKSTTQIKWLRHAVQIPTNNTYSIKSQFMFFFCIFFGSGNPCHQAPPHPPNLYLYNTSSWGTHKLLAPIFRPPATSTSCASSRGCSVEPRVSFYLSGTGELIYHPVTVDHFHSYTGGWVDP